MSLLRIQEDVQQFSQITSRGGRTGHPPPSSSAPLRFSWNQENMIVDCKLTYPSGTATAVLINGFHTIKGYKMAKKQVFVEDQVADELGDPTLEVLTFERFWHLEFLIKFVEHGCEVIPFSQAVPFFTNSDFDAPAVPVHAAQVLEWVLHNISASLERVLEKTPTKENGSTNAANLDMAIADGSINNSPSYSRSQTFVEGIFKASVMKQAYDIKGNSIKVLNCHDSVIYVLTPLKYATVYGCCESTIILGAIGKAVRVEHCERVQIITAARRICIANCRECVFFLGVNQQPLIIGENPKLQVAPYNTFYPQLEEHMAQLGINVTVNRWNEPYVLLKLLEKVRHQLFSVYASQILEKLCYECHALLQDDKVDDLSRMYRFFSRSPAVLYPVSLMFKQHVTSQGLALVKQAEDVVSPKKVVHSPKHECIKTEPYSMNWSLGVFEIITCKTQQLS